MKFPVPVPFVVLELLIFGFAVVAQQTPLTMTTPPPSAVIFPPETADVKVIEVAAVVVREASSLNFIQENIIAINNIKIKSLVCLISDNYNVLISSVNITLMISISEIVFISKLYLKVTHIKVLYIRIKNRNATQLQVLNRLVSL